LLYIDDAEVTSDEDKEGAVYSYFITSDVTYASPKVQRYDSLFEVVVSTIDRILS
jgi:hypothetical protein